MSYFYKEALSIYGKASKQNKKIVRLFLELIKQILIWVGKTSFLMEIRGRNIVLPISHKLPIYIVDFPLYDTLPTRIANYLRLHYGVLLMVDVGANVGDTILSCFTDESEDKFLGVEANPEFVSYLKINTNKIKEFTLIQAFCHSGNAAKVQVRIDSVGGTARVLEDKDGLAIEKKTLDEILAENVEFKKFNFLKLDTDGSDFEILKGAQKSIEDGGPIILMECDVFGNVNYVDDLLYLFDNLADAGYLTVIAYDNFGNYFSTFTVDEPYQFLDAIAYQIVSEFGYYDLLFLREEHEEFVHSEREFFSSYVNQKGFSSALKRAFNMRFEQL